MVSGLHHGIAESYNGIGFLPTEVFNTKVVDRLLDNLTNGMQHVKLRVLSILHAAFGRG
jgi:hypothetical protein